MSDALKTFIERIDSLDLRDGLKDWPAPLRCVFHAMVNKDSTGS